VLRGVGVQGDMGDTGENGSARSSTAVGVISISTSTALGVNVSGRE
jgi:hypothetical protein